jgi:hypothetical protein
MIGIKENSKISRSNLIKNSGYLKLCHNSTTTHFFTSYAAPGPDGEQEFQDMITNILQLDPDEKFLAIGDFNARLGGWQSCLQEELGLNPRTSKDPTSNSRGKKLIKLSEENGWVICNGARKGDTNGELTFTNANGGSVIDICFSSINAQDEIIDFKVLSSTSSHHHPILLTIQVEFGDDPQQCVLSSEPPEKLRRIKWTKEKCGEFLSTYRNLQINSQLLTNDWNNIKNNVYQAADLCKMTKFFPCIPTNEIRKARWFDNECLSAKQDVKWRIQLIRAATKSDNNFPQLLHSLAESKKSYQNLKREKKKSQTKLNLDKILKAKGPADFWNGINQFRKSKTSNQIPQITKESWHNHFSTLFSADDEQTLECLGETSTPIGYPITILEFMEATRKLRTNKAPGLDGIPNEVWKAITLDSPFDLLKMYNEILASGDVPDEWCTILLSPIFKKGDKNDPQNYRPISLVATILKLLTSILSKRLQEWSIKNKHISQFQAGFRKGMGTMEQVFGLLTLVQSKLKSKNGKLFAIFVDARSAFDSVSHSKLWRTLNKMGISSNVSKLFQKIYTLANGRVKTSSGLTDSFPFKRGVLQGESASPQLFNLFLEAVVIDLYTATTPGVTIGNCPVHILLFADDVVLVASSPEFLQQKINTLSSTFMKLGLKVNISKTKVIIFSKERIDKSPYRFLWDTEEIEIVSEYIYLGVKITERGKIEDTAELFINKAKSAIPQIWEITRRARIPPIETHVNLFSSLVKSVLLYCVPLWGQTEKTQKVIERVQNQFIKSLLYLPKCTPDYFIRLELGLKPVRVQIFKATLGFIQKLLNHDPSSFLGECLRWQIRWANRPCARGRVNWFRQVSRTLGAVCEDAVTISNLNNFTEKLQIFKLAWVEKYRLSIINDDTARMTKSTFIPKYRMMKTHVTREPYLNMNLSISDVRVIAQTRLSLFRIRVGSDRVPLEKECCFCGQNPSSMLNHLLFQCRHTASSCQNFRRKEQYLFETFYKSIKYDKEELSKILPALRRIRNLVFLQS